MHRLLALALLVAPGFANGYAVLTHEAIIDTAWLDSIQPLLVKRFPQASPEELRKAHAYVYGGCILQDLGYYPFGSKFFSDLVHYVRSGDFVMEMLRESQDLNEYAFALGSLAHYAADNNGHPIAVNPAVSLSYPELRARYGKIVTYEDNPAAHMKVEFGFDVLQVAQGHYASEQYHDFIGFEVSKRLLESAFQNTYGLELKSIFFSLDLALETYRHTVSSILPEATKVAWELKKDEIVKTQPGITRSRFLYNLSRSSYRREWGRQYQHPGPFAKVLAFLFRIFPKVGPFRGIQFRPPTSETEKLFMASFDATLGRYRGFLHDVRDGGLRLVNRDFDTGRPTEPAEYRMADDAYAKLARTLADKRFEHATPEIRENVLAFFHDPDAKFATRRNKKAWRDTLRAISELKQRSPAASSPAPAAR